MVITVTTQILDDATPGTETGSDPVRIVLVAVDSVSTSITDLVDGDGKLIFDAENSTAEGSALYYIPVAIDADGKPLSIQDGTVTLTYGSTPDVGDQDAVAGNSSVTDADYDDTVVTSATVGQVFKVDANDDYFAEGDETFTVTISNITGSSYETPSIDTNHDMVTSTISDNPAKIDQSDTSIDPDDPSSGSYGSEDTVYASITGSSEVNEGSNASYTITLKDSEGANVKVTSPITVTVTFTDSGAESGDYVDTGNNPLSGQTLDIIINPEGGGANGYSATFDITAINDFVAEYVASGLGQDLEDYTVSITGFSNTDQFENIVVDDTNSSVTTQIKDVISLGTPDSAYVDESDFSSTASELTGKLWDDQGGADPQGDSSSGLSTGLGIVTSDANYNNYSLIFDGNNPIADVGGTIKSSGIELAYDFTQAGKVIGYLSTGNATDDKVFEIELRKEGNGGADDVYVFTQYENIDHPVVNSDDSLTISLGFQVTDANGDTSTAKTLNIRVNDSLPDADDQTFTMDEDTVATVETSTFWLTNEGFKDGEIKVNNGLGEQTLSSGQSIYLYDSSDNDHSHVIGQLTNNGDGSLTFVPGVLTNNGDGSLTFVTAANYSGTPSFDYSVTDNDGDTATGTVNITVTPVTDTPDLHGDISINIVEDNANTEEGTYSVALGLTLPTPGDATDQTADNSENDEPERFGLITLSGIPDGVIIEKADGTDLLNGTASAGNSIKIYIDPSEDGQSEFHYSGIDTTDAITLSKTEFKALKFIHVEDDASDFTITQSVTAYEVNDDGSVKADVTPVTETIDINVDVLAATDSVSLEFTSEGDVDADSDNTTHSSTMTEDEWFDIGSILSASVNDNDDSETYSLKLTGLPEGSIIKVGSNSHTITKYEDENGYTIELSGKSITDLQFQPPVNFSGDIEDIGIQLIAHDTDSDSTNTDASTTGTTTTTNTTIYDTYGQVTLNLYVKPATDGVTIENATTPEDTAVAAFKDGNDKLAIKSKDLDGSEIIAQVVIKGIQANWILKDQDGQVVALTGNDTDGYSVTVTDVANLKDYTLTPPAHSSTDLNLLLDITVSDSVDSSKASGEYDYSSDVATTVLQDQPFKVTVTPVAEVTTPNTGGSLSTDSDGDSSIDLTINPNHTYVTTNPLEDGDNGTDTPVWFALGTNNGFYLKVGWTNQDDTDPVYDSSSHTQTDSEQTFALLTFMASDSDSVADAITGSQYRYQDGSGNWVTLTDTNGRVEIPVEYLDTLEFIAPANLSGDYKILVEAKTVDHDEDSPNTTVTQISGQSFLTFTIKPVADDVTVAIKQAFGSEDAGRKDNGSVDVSSDVNGINLDVTVTTQDTDGSEYQTIVLSDIPNGAVIYYNGAPYENSDSSNDTWSLTIEAFDNDADFKYVPVYNDNSDVTLLVTAYSVDSSDEGEKDEGEKVDDLALNIKIQGVADKPTNSGTKSETIEDSDDTSHSYNAIVPEDIGSVSLQTLFENDQPNFSSADIGGGDGSEDLFVTITLTQDQVDAGFGISGSGVTKLSDTNWIVESANFGNAQLDIPANYNGTVAFNLDLQTVEDDDLSGDTQGDSEKKTIPLSVLITPEADGVLTGSATQQEDTDQALSFTFTSNGGTNEQLTGVWINTATIPEGIELVTGSQTLVRTAGENWVELNVSNNIVEEVTARFQDSLHDSDADYSFEFRYTVSDSTPAGDDPYTVTSEDKTGTYNVTVNAVTDTATLSLGEITDVDRDGNSDLSYNSATRIVTVTDNTVFDVPFTLIANDVSTEKSADGTSSGNGQDIDGSETIVQTVELYDVPEGIDVEGGRYLGDITDDDGNTVYTGRWRVDTSNDLTIDNASGETNSIRFIVDRETYTDINQDITIQVSHQDTSGEVLSNEVSFKLVIDGDTFGSGGSGTTPEVDQPMDIVVALNDVEFTEDTSRNLDELVSVTDGATSGDSSKYTITIKNLEGASLSGAEYVDEDGGYYTLSGEGDVSDVMASLELLTLTPTSNANINTPTSSVDFDIVITTYGLNEHNSYPIDNATFDIAPVTDESTLSITEPTILEDTATDFVINLANDADNPRQELIDGKLYIQVTHTTSIDGGDQGSFTLKNGTTSLDTDITSIAAGQVIDGQTPANELPAGDYIVIDGASFGDSYTITYTPPANQHGNDVSIKAWALTREDPKSSGYSTATWLTSSEVTATVQAVNDGLTNADPTMTGDEDGIALLDLGDNVALADANSEGITSATLTGVPLGYEVLLNGVKQTGTVSGVYANGDYLYDYTFNVTSINELEKIGIQRTAAVEHFSGTIEVGLAITSGESGMETAQSWPNFQVSFNPVADDLLNMEATKTFGDEYTWVALNLNANVADTDGSETLMVTFEGENTALDDTALFRLNGTVLDAPQASFDNGKWVITDLPYDQIGNIEMLYHAFNDDVNVTVQTVDSVTGLPTLPTSTLETGSDSSFNLRLDESQTINTGDEDNSIVVSAANGATVNSGAGNDTIVGGAGADTINAGSGDDVIDGGGDTDTVVYGSDITDYQMSYDAISGELTISGPEGTDTLTNVEQLTFNGTTYTLELGSDNDDTINVAGSGRYLIVAGAGSDNITADADDYVVSGNASNLTPPVPFSSLDTEMNDEGTANNGVIIDGIIEGMYYETSSGITGYTDAQGGFSYQTGDIVIFSVGGVVIGTAMADDLARGNVFLQDLADVSRTDLSSDYVQKMAVFLQSLDSEGNTEGGIQISAASREALAATPLNLSSASMDDVNNLLVAQGITPVELMTAMEHVQDMLVNYTELDEE
ncbi:MAG: hypothetical protein DSY85_03240, partial [Marinomonas sp.]